MMAEKALSKMGHRWTPKGLSMLGNGMDLKRSWEEDIVGVRSGMRIGIEGCCMSARIGLFVGL